MSNQDTMAGGGVRGTAALPFADAPGTREVVGYCQYAPLSVPDGPEVTLASMLCFAQGWRLVVLAKASFRLDASPMPPAAAPPIVLRDATRHANPVASLAAASDMVPGRTRVDVTAVGHAYPSGGARASQAHARLALHQEDTTLIDKRIHVVSEEPFERIPLIYERAVGGAGTDNPIGIDEEEDERPQLLDPNDPGRPIGFGPIGSSWPARRRLVSKEVLQGLQQHPVQLKPQLDWRYFQAAPADQQIDQLSPHATLVLEGFHPDHPSLEATLPGAVAVGVVFGLDPSAPEQAHPLGFRADTVAVDGDRLLCTVTWRTVIEVPAESAVPCLVVAAGVHTDRAPLELPTERPEVVSEGQAAPLSASASAEAGATMAVSSRPAHGAALPFGPGGGQAIPRDNRLRATTAVTGKGTPLPFRGGAAAAPAPVASRLGPAPDVGATLGPGMPTPGLVGPLSSPKRSPESPPGATPAAPPPFSPAAPPARLDGVEPALGPPDEGRVEPEEPSVPLTAAASVGDDEPEPAGEAPEAVPAPTPQAAQKKAAQKKAAPKKKPTKKKRKPVAREKRHISAGTDLNALLYGKK